MPMTLGIDLACRAAHVASLAGPDGTLIWRGSELVHPTRRSGEAVARHRLPARRS